VEGAVPIDRREAAMQTDPEKSDPETIVRALLAAAGIAPPEDEVAKMIASYPGLRAAADGLYTEAISRFLPAPFPTDEELEAR